MTTKRRLLLLAVLAALIACAVVLPAEQLLAWIQQWAAAYPALGPWLVGAVFLSSVILLLPASPIVMLAGFLFGMVKGFALIWLTGVLASTLAFWIGRSSARRWVERKIRNRTVFVAIDRAIERNGLRTVLLTRLAMVFPYGPLNYTLGLSSVRYRDYFFGTNIGMIPSFLIVIYLGKTAGTVVDLFTDGAWPQGKGIILGLLTLATLTLVTALIARSANKILREELAELKRDEDSGFFD